jgi:hypothetical protein
MLCKVSYGVVLARPSDGRYTCSNRFCSRRSPLQMPSVLVEIPLNSGLRLQSHTLQQSARSLYLLPLLLLLCHCCCCSLHPGRG